MRVLVFGGLVFLFLFFFFFGFWTRDPRKPTRPATLARGPCGSDQTRQLRRSHQARVLGHAVEETPSLQEVGGGAALPHLSFVQDDHPARGGDADVSGREGAGTPRPREHSWASPGFGAGP